MAKKIKFLVIGADGMLGSAVCDVLESKHDANVVKMSRRLDYPYHIEAFEIVRRSVMPYSELLMQVRNADFVINCIGVIKQEFDLENAICANSIFPHVLNEMCGGQSKLIHVTTDCVFSGSNGPYYEDSLHDCTDHYGKSKSLGEPAENCICLRTSIIGEEIMHTRSLVEWCKSMRGKEVNGYVNHLWNGVTTKEFGECVYKIAKSQKQYSGTYHLFSTDVTKYEMVRAISDKFNLDIILREFETPMSIDRRLRTRRDLCDDMRVPDFYEMLRRM